MVTYNLVRIGPLTWGILKKVHLFLLVIVVVVLVIQFESLYHKNCKRYRSELLHTSRV